MAPEEDSENDPARHPPDGERPRQNDAAGAPRETSDGDRSAGGERRLAEGTESPTLGPEDWDQGELLSGPLAQVGATWGHLEVLRKLGEGEFGEVYQCRDPSLDMVVALKLIRRRVDTGSADLSDALRSFLREGRFLARVRHPNVVTVYGAAAHDGVAGIWMEYVRGRTLAELLKRQGLFGAREASLIGTDLCRALAAVHAEGVIHRDIKIQNVIREEGGRIVLMDFGAGRDLVKRREDELRVAGTPLYMAPETLLEGVATQRSDLYSLGVLVFHLVTGTFPITGSGMEEILEAYERRRSTPLRDLRPDLPTGFVRTVERAIAFDPDERFASAGEMERALESQGETTVSWDRPTAAGRQGPDAVTAETRTGTWILRGLAGLALAIFLGTMTSVAYRLSLGIPAGFEPEGLLEDLSIWGLRTVIPALAIMLLILAGLGLVLLLVRTAWWCLEALAPRRTVDHLRRRFLGIRWKIATFQPGVLARFVFLAGLAALVGLVYTYSGLLQAVIDLMAEQTALRARVELLDPTTRRPLHYFYFASFAALILALLGGLWGISALTDEREPPTPVDRAARAGIVVLALAAATVMVLPWRLLFHSDGEPVCYDDSRAYVIGERDEDVLLYFPGTRRTRRIREGSELLEREAEGRREFIFAADAAPCGNEPAP